MKDQINNKVTNSEYENLISETLKNSSAKEKSITLGKIISIENEIVTIDVGLKVRVEFIKRVFKTRSKMKLKR